MQRPIAPTPELAFDKSTARQLNTATCPYCEYDRRFPGFEGGGWVRHTNSGPVVPCQLCNPDGKGPVFRAAAA